jgi:hypothetical protein
MLPLLIVLLSTHNPNSTPTPYLTVDLLFYFVGSHGNGAGEGKDTSET